MFIRKWRLTIVAEITKVLAKESNFLEKQILFNCLGVDRSILVTTRNQRNGTTKSIQRGALEKD